MSNDLIASSSEMLPLLPLRGIALFPGIMVHFDVGREKSILALEKVMESDQRLFVVAQRKFSTEDPFLDDLYSVGTVVRVRQVVKLPDGVFRVLADGESRALLLDAHLEEGHLVGEISKVDSRETEENRAKDIAYMRTAKRLSKNLLRLRQANGPVNEAEEVIQSEKQPGLLADMIAWQLLSELEDRQAILECRDVSMRIMMVTNLLSRELEVQNIERQIQETTVRHMEQNQKEYFLREKIKTIQQELGESDQSDEEELRARMSEAELPEEVRERADKELKRLSHMAPGTPEINVSRTYVEWLLDMPWGKFSAKSINIPKARKILDADHYGLAEVKERILEFLAVRSLKGDMKGPILCLVGPPGVGKTSIARSVARALGREFTRMSLGGVRDEAEIRGHRRTYIGAIPGRVATALKQCGCMDPVFLLDEIDKMASDYKGDPASAMLEVLDPEQNNSFRDHYLDVALDLSKVLFLTTANTLDTIPPALRDRMEIIEINSYTQEEKVQIARRHLLAKQMEQHGLNKSQLKLSEKTIFDIVEYYTREAGVRTLERLLGTICRKVAVKFAEGVLDGDQCVTVKPQDLSEYLGAKRYLRDEILKKPEVGVVNGLAWTAVGGETLPSEVAVMPGAGDVQLTGQLGNVMKESARTALSYIRTQSKRLSLSEDFVKTHDLHIHVPEGAVPKDGPSAGVAMTCAMVSAMTGKPARQDVAMTGEVTLLGRVLPIGGVKEKVMAAQRMGIHTVLLPRENAKDIEEIPQVVRDKLDIQFIGRADQALKIILNQQGGVQ